MGIPGALRPRSNTEILDAAFALARRHMAQLLPISLAFGLPVSVFVHRYAGIAATGGSLLGRTTTTLVLLFVLLPILENLRVWILEAALIESVVNGQVSWAAVRRRFSSVFWRLLGSQIALVVLGSLCSIPVVVPGVIFTLHRIFYSEVLLVEGKSVSSFRRSFALTDGRLGRLGSLVLAGTLLLGSLGWGFSLWASKNLLGAALGWFGAACLAPLKASLYLLAYYDLRSRREGVDLLARDAELEARTGTAPSPA